MADNIRYDQGYHWDDGNRYDQPPVFPLPKLKGRKRMGANFIPPAQGDYRAWLLNLKTELTTLGTTFGATTAEVTAVTAAATAQLALIDGYETKKSDAAFALQARDDGRTATDIILREQIGDWKRLGGFTPAIADQLRAVGTTTTFDPSTYKPTFKIRLDAGNIRLDWTKKGVTAVHIYARLRGQPGWTLIGMDTSSPYIDGRELAVATVPETREYKLRGVLNDVEIGLDSDIQSITWSGA
jgi:hypothetical protein